jgi:UMF1 family MFS transporter
MTHLPGRQQGPLATASWALYDFGNSAFTTLVVTFIYATYFTRGIAADETVGTALWSRGVTVTAIAVAVLSPILGAVADRGGYRRLLLVLSTATCIGATCFLYFALPGQVGRALTWFVVANVAFEMGGVFYNAFLPDVAPPDRIGRVSGYGWALGYVGGLLCMVIALFGFVQPEVAWLGFSTAAGENIRATNLLVAVWFAVFSLPMILFVKEDKSRVSPPGTPIVRTAVRQLYDTFHEVRRYGQVVRLLVARLFYNDGLVTIFAFGAIYAQGTFGFTTEEILVFGIVLNVTAGLGAFAMGFLDDVIGGKRTIQISLIGLFAASLLAVLSPSKSIFWVAGILVGIFAGPNQAASRSLLGRFVPPTKENEFFGFFAFSGKATAFLGPFSLGVLTTLFHTQRAGVAVVLVFFAVGAAVLATVDEAAGIRLAARQEPSSAETSTEPRHPS